MANGSPQKVIINERAAARLRGGHVWVYASDVLNEAGAQPGALVQVVGPKSKVLGAAIYSSASQLRLRLLRHELISSEEELLRLVPLRVADVFDYGKIVVQDCVDD